MSDVYRCAAPECKIVIQKPYKFCAIHTSQIVSEERKKRRKEEERL